MKRKLYDVVKLKKEREDLSARGIQKDCYGVLTEIGDTECLVFFLNPLNHGDYAFATVRNDELLYVGEMKNFLPECDFVRQTKDRNKTSFKPTDVKEYDEIEMLAEKPCYAMEGVHKGMRGVVMASHAIRDKWYVIFSDETGKDIADICVAREDFKVISEEQNETTD